MPKYVKAEPGPGTSVIYTDSDGKKWKFEGGTRPWRNQNPGNLVSGQVSRRNNAIGSAGGFAVFRDYETGHTALLDLLRNVYGDRDIPALMKKYAPPEENKTEVYVAFIRKKTGVKGAKKIKDFLPFEFEKLWKAIEAMEGWGKVGTITEISSKSEVTAVKKDKKGTIQSYQITGYGWVSKTQGIALALKGKVNAVVATSATGNQFLRARPNQDPFDNLENKG